MIEMPFFLGILIFLIIFMVFIRIYMEIANFIGEEIRMLFTRIWEGIKELME